MTRAHPRGTGWPDQFAVWPAEPGSLRRAWSRRVGRSGKMWYLFVFPDYVSCRMRI